MRIFLTVIPLLFTLSSCQVLKPYAPPPQKALVESVEVELREFAGRPEAHAVVKGRLTSNVAQLVDSKQSRIDSTLYIDVMEQTPRDAALLPNLSMAPPFQTRIPIELLGLEPGEYTLSANGITTTFEIPTLYAAPASFGEESQDSSSIEILDEFVPIEEWNSVPETSESEPL